MGNVKIIGTETIEPLVTLAKYFRKALKDEVSLPESGIKIPDLVQVDNVKMVKLSGKTTYYRKVLDNIEQSLESYALQLTAQSPQIINKVVEKVAEKELVVDAETSVITETVNESTNSVIALMPKKENIKKRPTFKSLFDLPKEKLTDEFKDSIVKEWQSSKGNVAKAKLYTKVKDLLNNQDLGITNIRSILSKFVQVVIKEQANANLEVFAEEIKKEGIDTAITVPLESLIKGEELLNGKTLYTVDNNFNLMLLTGKNNVDNVNPQDFVKQRAMYLRITGRENQAIDELTKFYSDSKTGSIWPVEKVRWFLNNLFITNSFKHLEKLIENILVFKQEQKGSYKEGIKHAKNLVRAYTRYTVNEKGTSKTKRTWEDSKINNFIDKLIVRLNDNGVLKPSTKKEEIVKEEKSTTSSEIKILEYSIKVTKDSKQFFQGKVEGPGVQTIIKGYAKEEDFKQAVNTLIDVHVKAQSADTEQECKSKLNFEYDFSNKADGTATKTEEKTKPNSVPSNQMAVSTKSETVNNVAKETRQALVTLVEKSTNILTSIYSFEKSLETSIKEAIGEKDKKEFRIKYFSKAIAEFNKKRYRANNNQKVKEEPNEEVKGGEKFQKTPEEKEALKQAKKDTQSDPKLTIKSTSTDLLTRPQYSATITLETDGTYSCTLNGFNETIKTTGSKSMESAKIDFVEALLKYSQKIKKENEKAKNSTTKGKQIHMKPDFSSGDITFLAEKTAI